MLEPLMLVAALLLPADAAPIDVTAAREKLAAGDAEGAVAMLQELSADPAFGQEDAGARQRIQETLALMTALSSWGEEMLRLEPATLMKVMKLGSRIQKLLRDGERK